MDMKGIMIWGEAAETDVICANMRNGERRTDQTRESVGWVRETESECPKDREDVIYLGSRFCLRESWQVMLER